MLNSLGRAAVRRAHSLSTRMASTSITSSFSALSIQPVAVRTFSGVHSPLFAAAKKPSSGTETKKTTKTPAKKKAAPVQKKKRVAAKKVLTPEQEEKAKIRELKAEALYKKEPSSPRNSWSLYMTEKLKNSNTTNLGDKVRELSNAYMELPEYEKEEYRAKAKAAVEENHKKYKEWIESHPVEVIYVANVARSALNRKLSKRITKLSDDRLPKRPANAYALFVTDNVNKYTGMAQSELFKMIAGDWKKLGESEKRPFEERAAQALSRHSDETKELHEKVALLRKERRAGTKST